MGGSFTPFVISTDGVLAPQAWNVIQTLEAQLTEKHNSLCNASFGETINWLRLRLQFASVRAASLVVVLVVRATKKNYCTLVPSRLRRDVPSCPDGYTETSFFIIKGQNSFRDEWAFGIYIPNSPYTASGMCIRIRIIVNKTII
jgi:hypothetical protein